MNIFKIFFIFFSLIGAAFANSLNYDIEYVENPILPYFKIKLNSFIPPSGKFLLKIPERSMDVKITSENGIETLHTTTSSLITPILASSNSPFEIEYIMWVMNPHRKIDSPIIEKDFFVFRIEETLPTPFDTSSEKWLINIELRNIPADYFIATSFNNQTKRIMANETITNFKNSVIAGGKDLNITKLYIHDRPVTIIRKGKFDGEKPEQHIEKLISEQRKLWNDYDIPHYLITIMDNPCEGVQGGFRGAHFENAILIKWPTSCEKDKFPMYKKLVGLSHELSHAWNTSRIKFAHPKHKLQWFLEGFNDYYGARFAYKTGIISFEDYLDYYNHMLRYYSILPTEAINNNTKDENFFKDYQLTLINEYRGHLLAKELEFKLTQKGKSIDALMHQIHMKYKELGKPLTTNDVKQIFTNYLGIEEARSFFDQIEKGEKFILSKYLFQPLAKLEYLESEVANPGFDLHSLFEHSKIKNLDKSSPAFKAGLREGDIIEYYDLGWLKPDRIMDFAIKEDTGSIREIHFKADVIKQKIPQYVLNAKLNK